MNDLLQSREEVKRAYLEIQKYQNDREFSKEEAEGRVSSYNHTEQQISISDSEKFGQTSENLQPEEKQEISADIDALTP
tara:strand:+ start:80 stop:316 length:237 start_codon:yes stop_codon:yes gene_type:complete